MSQVPFLPAAEEEFLEAVAAYEAARPGVGGEFLAEVERAARRIISFPDHGSPYLAGTRRIVLRRFPYNVVYWPDPEDLLVVAVAHQRRKPGYWRGRISALRAAHPTSGLRGEMNADDLLRFASTLEGERLTTRARHAEFSVHAVSGGIEITPVSSGTPRFIPRSTLEHVCEEYLSSGSTRPGDYQKITFDASTCW